ncbi:hypothetical protein D3C78_1755130 [compost metagenome]
MLGQRLGIPQADCPAEQLQGIHETPPGSDPALELERDHATWQAHLPAGQLVLGEGRQAGVVDHFHSRVLLEELGDYLGVAAVSLHAQGQGLHATHEQGGIVG